MQVSKFICSTEKKNCVKTLNFLYDNYKNIEIQYSVNYLMIRLIVSNDEEFYYDELSLNFLEFVFNDLKLSNVGWKSKLVILKLQRSYSKFETTFVFKKC